MTKAQHDDIELAKYFIPEQFLSIPITLEDEIKYLGYSEQGRHKDDAVFGEANNGFQVLLLGKSRRGLHVDLWEQGVLEGTFPYADLFNKSVPRMVIDFMKKEMFKGRDAELIETIYSGTEEDVSNLIWRGITKAG